MQDEDDGDVPQIRSSNAPAGPSMVSKSYQCYNASK